nr:hypothetical protein [Nanoarchaeota archaeon]
MSYYLIVSIGHVLAAYDPAKPKHKMFIPLKASDLTPIGHAQDIPGKGSLHDLVKEAYPEFKNGEKANAFLPIRLYHENNTRNPKSIVQFYKIPEKVIKSRERC